MSTRSSRTHRPVLAAWVACAVWIAIAGISPIADARQDAGSLPPSIVNSSTALTPEQRERVRVFADGLVRNLAIGEPAQVTRSRNELAQTPGRPGATPAFQRDFAAIVRPMLEPIIFGEDDYRAVNALIVVRAMRTPEAVEMLARLSAPRNERRTVVRVRAASLLTDAIADAPLNPAQIDGVARAVTEAASNDPEWIAAHHGFRTLARIASRPGLPTSSMTLALDGQIAVVQSLVVRAEREPAPSESVNALARSLLVARDQLPALPPEQAATLRRNLAEPLARLAKVAESHWEAARGVPDSLRAYGDALNAANLLLKLEAASRQSNLQIDLGAKWRSGDRTGFSADAAAAQSMVSRS